MNLVDVPCYNYIGDNLSGSTQQLRFDDADSMDDRLHEWSSLASHRLLSSVLLLFHSLLTLYNSFAFNVNLNTFQNILIPSHGVI